MRGFTGGCGLDQKNRCLRKAQESFLGLTISQNLGNHHEMIFQLFDHLQAKWNFNEHYASFTITSKAFLYHMVRRIVFFWFG